MIKTDNHGVEFKHSLEKVPFSFISSFFFIFFFLEVLSSCNFFWYMVCRYFDKKQEKKNLPLVKSTKVALEQNWESHLCPEFNVEYVNMLRGTNAANPHFT